MKSRSLAIPHLFPSPLMGCITSWHWSKIYVAIWIQLKHSFLISVPVGISDGFPMHLVPMEMGIMTFIACRHPMARHYTTKFLIGGADLNLKGQERIVGRRLWALR